MIRYIKFIYGGVKLLKLETVNYIIIHHTERNNDFPLFIKIRHIFLRKWEDIGYHHLIGNTRPFTRDGKLYPGRKENFQGAHAFGYNCNSLSVCLIGNFDKKKPSKKQLQTLYSFLLNKITQYSIPIENILGHNELSNVTKSCPGKHLDMDKIRKEIKQKIAPA